MHNGYKSNICNIGKDFSLLFSVFSNGDKGERAMKKNMLRIMATVTIMGGLFVSTNVPNVKAEEYPEMIVFDDVPVNHWAYDDIMDVVYNKVMLGYGNGKFG
ncbi:S-layer homology domain-containing protein, partial [Bacillus anthracis]|uniref:S-layer homology domain-containing protein n=1 Tax=Bacillus anthracis TaxID=1392 RepID=UPI002B4C238F